MGLRDHAMKELTAAGYNLADQNDPNKWMADNVMELLDVFAKQGHSGMSAGLCINLFKTLARYEVLSPIQGTEDEWHETLDDNILQNKRCSHVFKEKDTGLAYDIDGKIFREPNGACYTSKDSTVFITFPYTPTREYVDAD